MKALCSLSGSASVLSPASHDRWAVYQHLQGGSLPECYKTILGWDCLMTDLCRVILSIWWADEKHKLTQSTKVWQFLHEMKILFPHNNRGKMSGVSSKWTEPMSPRPRGSSLAGSFPHPGPLTLSLLRAWEAWVGAGRLYGLTCGLAVVWLGLIEMGLVSEPRKHDPQSQKKIFCPWLNYGQMVGGKSSTADLTTVFLYLIFNLIHN